MAEGETVQWKVMVVCTTKLSPPLTFSVVRVQKYLEGMSGRQVLGMSREALETAFGREEGSRLDSQITLSRNQTKYTQGKNSELRAILEKARKRTEIKKGSSTEELDNHDNSHV